MEINSKVKEKSALGFNLGIKNSRRYEIRVKLTLLIGLSEQMWQCESIAHGAFS